jgi:uncharacterized protein
MNYLITGGTGFIGQKLASKLIENKNNVHILTRDLNKISNKLQSKYIKYFLWNDFNSKPPKESFENIDCVINLLGENLASKRWSFKQKEKIKNSRLNSTSSLVKGINEFCPNLNCFVSSSAIGYYDVNKEDVFDENSKPGDNFLSNLCSEWESKTNETNLSIRKVILRIGVVLGLGGGALSKLVPLFKMFAGGPIGRGLNWMSWIHVDDLVDLIIEASSNDDYNGVYNAVSPNPVQNNLFSEALGNALNRSSFMVAPPFMVKLTMGEMSTIALDSQIISSKKLLDAGFDFKFPEIRDALKDICN